MNNQITVEQLLQIIGRQHVENQLLLAQLQALKPAPAPVEASSDSQ